MQKIIVGNLKMNMENIATRNAYCKELIAGSMKMTTKNTVVVCPPTIYVEYFCRALQNTPIRVGAQDCFWELYGSFTGNTSPQAIHALGGRYVIVGHSERREHNHETNEDIVKKIHGALRCELTPIVCVGFLSHGDEMESIHNQISAIMEGLSATAMQKIMIAYEPVWAIGSGKTPTSDDIHTMVMYIRSLIAQHCGKEQSLTVPILYGGSVTPQNARALCVDAHTDGVLVGGASLAADRFMHIVRAISL
ncbi:MAG: triose-phosphate isomerase [Candidatus Moraniibacteriota bacterium]|nr:MAG: triose-phosphate isomerase [Candidatus Moranbacteria bacterium]